MIANSAKTVAGPESPASLATRRRELWLDVVKGLGIACVVVGHYTFPGARYLYWFHMPLFFMISGYFFKPVSGRGAFLGWLQKRLKRLLVPYAAFVLLLFTAESLLHPAHRGVISLLPLVAAGGRMFPIEYIGTFGAFWFVTCLFVTQVIFALLTFNNRRWIAVAGVAVAYVLAHVEALANLHHTLWVPLNVDVALMALSYYAIGFYCRPIIADGRLPKYIYLLAVVASAALIAGDVLKLFRYDLDMKYLGYTRPILDLVIPVTMLIAVCGVGRAIARMRIGIPIAMLGNASLTIMYLHMWVIRIVRDFYFPHLIDFTLIGIVIPVLIWWGILNRFRFTRRIFLGSA